MVPRYPFVHIDVPADDSDAAGALLFDLGAEGLEERDASTLVKGAVGLVTLVASFTSREDADAACSSLDAAWNPRVQEIVGRVEKTLQAVSPLRRNHDLSSVGSCARNGRKGPHVRTWTRVRHRSS